ncbi:hypothetical protein OPV22_014714 [Ensete ventricosum]|uniref:Uncharacterized protein n=1 Tax=Ensete ventricosum TaxID=4639 RepID=A0AAV8R3W4_ENSVE|nr:hypothetical protein OPV22_014714 [Ensete ventricosum]
MGDLTRGLCNRRRQGSVSGCLEMQFNSCSESSGNLLRLKLKEVEEPASLINSSISLHLDMSMMYRLGNRRTQVTSLNCWRSLSSRYFKHSRPSSCSSPQ